MEYEDKGIVLSLHMYTYTCVSRGIHSCRHTSIYKLDYAYINSYLSISILYINTHKYMLTYEHIHTYSHYLSRGNIWVCAANTAQ